VAVDETKRGSTRFELMSRLESCCNDTIVAMHELVDQEIPSKQMWSYILPDKGMFDPELQNFVKNNYRWAEDGAAIEFDYQATSEVFTTPSYSVSEALIQVMIFPRADFFEYFEAGNLFCNKQNLAVGLRCRPNPCLSSAEKQTQGTEVCLSRPSMTIDPVYAKQTCSSYKMDGKEYQDMHCHDGDCLNDPKPGDKVWGALPEHGCEKGRVDDRGAPVDPWCCSDSFLYTFCLNKPCDKLATRQKGVARHLSYPIPNTLKKAKSGYAVVIRNMALQPIRVSGGLRIRKAEFPCTLESCCTSQPSSGCCPRNYTRLYVKPDPTCGKCSRDETDPSCRPYESSEVPSWSARGPAKVQKSSGGAGGPRGGGVNPEVQNLLEYGADQGGVGWQKPDLVAPGVAVSANSDGNRNSAGDGEEYGVQCDKDGEVKTSIFGCDVLKALPYSATAAKIQKTGSSVAAAFIAGAAVVIRQYLVEGFYPAGVRTNPRKRGEEERNTVPEGAPENPWAKPPASLIKAMLIHSASGVGGSTNTHTYFPDPACNQAAQNTPCPLVSRVSRAPLPPTPNQVEGFGRPRLDNVLWFADSPWSLLLRTQVHKKRGWMHTYKFRLLDSLEPLAPHHVPLYPPRTRAQAKFLKSPIHSYLM
jgi:hypothetical protein